MIAEGPAVRSWADVLGRWSAAFQVGGGAHRSLYRKPEGGDISLGDVSLLWEGVSHPLFVEGFRDGPFW